MHLDTRKQHVVLSQPWQRCQFHLPQNASRYVPRVDVCANVASDIGETFNAPDGAEAKRLLERFVKRYAKAVPKLAE